MGDALDRLKAKLANAPPREVAPIRLATVTMERPVVGHPRVTEDGLEWVDAHKRRYHIRVGKQLETFPGNQFFTDLTPESKRFVVEELAKVGISIEGIIAQINDRLNPMGPDGERHLDIDALAEGARWYPMANKLAWAMSERSGGKVSPEQVAAVLAIMSPKNRWSLNSEASMRVVQFYADGHLDDLDLTDKKQRDIGVKRFREAWKAEGWGGAFADEKKGNRALNMFGSPIERSFEVLFDPDTIAKHLTGIKTHSFYNNIIDPEHSRDVTVDIHMTKIITWLNNALGPGPEKGGAVAFVNQEKHQMAKHQKGVDLPEIQVSGVGFTAIAAATRMLADDWGVPPHVVQAAYWVKVRDLLPPGWEPSPGFDIDTPLVDDLLGEDNF